jgi:uncharacterized protein with HEPN domain
MKKQRDHKSVLFDILSCSKNCIEFTKGMTLTEFEKDIKTISAVQHQLMIIGEATKKLTEEFRNTHDDIPWKKMAGTRDVLIHSYEEADLEIIWDIVTIQILGIIPKLEKILSK